ncbi:MAG: Acyl-[acyl-carrier-protein]--UDP-N-acetylglucosamine O-acyltransferase, partial [uncultured Ramlibacter sp.]
GDPSHGHRGPACRDRRHRQHRALHHHRPRCEDRSAHHGGPAHGHRGPHDDRRRQPDLPVRQPRLGQPGPEVPRRTHEAGHRRPQHDPRIQHLPGRDRAGRRRHSPGQRQLDDGLHPPGARLPGGRPHHLRQQQPAGRPRRGRRLGHPGRLHRGPPVRAHRRARHDGHVLAAVRRPAAVRDEPGAAGAGPLHELRRTSPPRFLGRPHQRREGHAQGAVPRRAHPRAGAAAHPVALHGHARSGARCPIDDGLPGPRVAAARHRPL